MVRTTIGRQNGWNTFLRTLRAGQPPSLRRPNSAGVPLQSLEQRVLLSIDPIGPQFNIAESFGAETNPAVVDAYGDGDFVMAWQSYEDIDATSPSGDDSGFGVYAGRFDETGTLQGSVIQVNAFETGDQLNPAIAADANGNFVVVWQSRNIDDPTAEGYDIYYQLFDNTGTAIGGETRANQDVIGNQVNAAVGMDADGDFMIVWQGSDASGTGIFGRGFDEAGVAQGDEFLINTITDGDQLYPAVDAQNTNDGIYVVAWHGAGEPVEGEEGEEASVEVWVNVFSNDLYPATGSRALLPTDLQANVSVEHDQNMADVAVDAEGDFVVVWQTEGLTGSGSDVFGRLFDFDPLAVPPTSPVTPVTGDFRANTETAEGQRSAAVDMDDAGNFLVSWQSSHQDGFSWGIFGQAYSFNGTEVGTEIQVNTETSGPQTQPDVGIAPGGQTIVTWLGREPVTHDFGVHAQRFNNAGPSRVGDELFLVSAISLEDDAPSVAADAKGNFVAVWQSYDEDGSGLGIFGRLYAADGTPLTAAFLVNSTTIGNQSHPRVARAANGNFVVVWQTDSTAGAGHEIKAQLFGVAGNKIGGEIAVNTSDAGDQAWPSVAMDAVGNFVVVWEGAGLAGTDGSRDVYYQRFDAAGNPIGTEQRVNTETVLDQFMPTVAMNAAGEFVIAWVSDHPAADPLSLDTEKTVFVQKYDADGNVVGAAGDTLVNQYTEEAQEYPAVAIDANGNFVVVWQAINHPDEGGGGSWGVFARRFDALKQPLGDEFLVNTTTAEPQRFPTIAMDGVGNFIISWQSQNQDGSSWGIYTREYLFNGTPLTGEVLVNNFEDGPQILPTITWSQAGTVVIAWEGRGLDPNAPPQGSGAIEGVHARIFEREYEEYRFEAEGPDANHLIGRSTPDGWSANVALDDAGFLVYGPYTTEIPEGWHEASFRLLVDNNTADNLAVVRIDVYDAATGTVLAEQTITRKQFDAAGVYQEFDLTFYSNDDSNLEFRTYWLDTSYVQQDVVIVSPIPTLEVTYEAETDFNHLIGRVDGDGWSANVADDSAGFLNYGPYVTTLPVGVYRADFRLMVDNVSFDNNAVVTIDVVSDAGTTILASRTITRGEFEQAGVYQDFTLDFINTLGEELEFRTYWHDTAYVKQDSVVVTEVPIALDEVFEAESDMFHLVGRLHAEGWSANVAQDDAGFLAYGPYTSVIPAGLHVALFNLLVDNVIADDLPVVTIDVTANAGQNVLASRTITRSEFDAAMDYQSFALPFTNSAGEVLEFRVYTHDVSYVRFDNVRSYSVPSSQKVYEAENEPFHVVGRAEEDGWSANVVDDSPGYLMYGPYTSAIGAGPQTAEFHLLVDNHTAANHSIVTIDVYDAATNQVLAQRVITRNEFDASWTYQAFELDFDAPADGNLEFRTYWEGTSYVKLDRVRVYPSSLDDEGLTQVFEEMDELLLLA